MESRTQRVFTSGAAGFVGRRLVPRLLADGFAVTALLQPGERAEGLEGAEIRTGDVTRPDGLTGCIDGCDAVVHLAGVVGYGQSWRDCRAVNVSGTAHVAREAVRAGARRFVHMSSVSVYGRIAGRPLDEDAPLRTTGDPYGDTKIDAERIVRRYAQLGELALTVVRPTVIYGPGDARFLPSLVRNLRSGRARLVGAGRNTVDAIHVDDVVEFLCRVLRDARAVGRTYNLNHPANPTWAQLVTEVARTIGVDPPRRRLPYRLALLLAAGLEGWGWLSGRPPRLTRYAVRVVGRPYHYVTERARRELGFEPRIPLLEGVRAALAADAGAPARAPAGVAYAVVGDATAAPQR